MFRRLFQMFAAAALLTASLNGCVESPNGSHPAPPPLLTEPIGVQLTRAEPRVAGMPFRVLLDFERASDLVFLDSLRKGAERSGEAAHTGRSALRIPSGATIAIKLSSLLGSGPFPGRWTLAGGYFSARGKGAKVTLEYLDAAGSSAAKNTVEVSPGRWTPVFVDLSKTKSGAAGMLRVGVEPGQAVYCDDVVVLDNRRTLAAPSAGTPVGAAWTIRENGFEIVVERIAHYRLALKTPEAAADGWTVEEANDLRARFVSAEGNTWTMYLDGRQFRNGTIVSEGPLGELAEIYARQHATPADLIVRDEAGRIDRDTPGDKTNDGYNEVRGSYELIARGARFEATIKPNTRLLASPVLEIAGLPAGNVLATVEGQLIEKTTRLANGNLLVRLPITLERATTVNVAVK